MELEVKESKRDKHKRRTVEFLAHLKQDSARISRTNARLKEIHLAEEFLRSLPELSYHVTKINQWGKHQSRLVRLTADGIDNIRAGTVSSTHSYSEVLSVALRNLNTFVIQYLHAEHDYTYRSPVAVQIVHEISTRVALRRSTDKNKVSLDEQTNSAPALRHSTPVPLAIMPDEPLSEEYLSSLSSSERSSVSSNSSSLSSPSPPYPTSPAATSSSSLQSLDDASKRAAKLTKVLGTPQETRLHAEVDKLLWNEATPEGRTVSQFISDFYVLMKNPSTCLPNVRRFLDSMRMHIIEKRGGTLIKLVVNASNDLSPDEIMSFIIEKSLEQAVIGRIHKSIFATISATCKISDDYLASVVAQLKNKNQSFFGIPESMESNSGWVGARVELKLTGQCDTPGGKLSAILASAKAVFSIANFEQTTLNKKPYVVSADDFLPIFMYVLVQSDVASLESTNQFLWQLCDPLQLAGEGGYYLTVFSSIISLMHRINLSTLPDAVNLDDVLSEEAENKDTMLEKDDTKESEEGNGHHKWRRKVKFWK